jgi:hypothetical protein
MATPTMSKAAISNAATSIGAEWGRRRLLGILVTAVAVAALLSGGLVYALVLAVGGVGPQASPVDGAATGIDDAAVRDQQAPRGAAHRDRIAAAPMLAVPDDAMFPGEVAGSAPEGIEIPGGQSPGPAEVLTGFPQTPAGALGQLAQIDLAVLQAMSLPTAQEVYRAWALPGGIGPDRWRVTQSVQAFLSATSMGEVLDPGVAVEIEPAAGLVKGTDGPDWLVACVLLRVTASYRQEGQVAFAHCERMQWVGGRWMIAPGLPPTPAPASWPGTALANQAGWRPWITDH